MTLPELIANEVMNAIERERRINKDDLIIAADVAIRKYDNTDLPSKRDQPSEMMRIDSQKGGGFEFYASASPTFTHTNVATSCTATAAKAGYVSSAEAAQKAGSLVWDRLEWVWCNGRLVKKTSTNCTE